MNQLSKEDILEALKSVKMPNNHLDIVTAGIISATIVDNGKVGLVVDFGTHVVDDVAALRTEIETCLRPIKGITEVNAVMTAQKTPNNASGNRIKPAPAPRTPSTAAPEPKRLKGVKHVIAVASGKGGVGKSTTAVNLAFALKSLGLDVGILDADIFGPSLPTMLGVKTEKPPIIDGAIQPVIAHDIKTMSIGYLVDADQPIVWRGPKVMGAVQQLFKDVAWAPLDVLVVDLPPGTGDVQLSMAQQVTLSGAVIVSTPQDLALIDARKGLAMFKMVDIPILGVIENMSHFHCPSCGERAEIFGHGGARDAAKELGCHFLGEIPLHMSLREQGDAGSPAVLSDPDSPITAAYMSIASEIKDTLF